MNGIILTLAYTLGGGLVMLGLPALYETLDRIAARKEARERYLLRKDGTRIYYLNK